MNHETRRRLANQRAERQTKAAGPFTKQAQRLFDRELAGIVAADPTDVDVTLTQVDDEGWERWLQQIWEGWAVAESWDRTIATITSVKVDAPRLPEPIRIRLREYIAGRRQTITDRTREDLQELFAAGMTPSTLLKSIRQLYEHYRTDRAQRLAIQNVLAAAETVQHAAAQTAAAQLNKIWTTVGDQHVRRTHSAADGQRRPIEDPFVVGGYMLDHPRDPAGPVEETINCRCTAFYEPDTRRRIR